MKPFLEELAQQLHKNHTLGPKSLFVLPSVRAGNYLRQCLALMAEKPLFSPSIISIEQFVQNISNLEAVSNTELLFLLYRAYLNSNIKSKDSFLEFSSWGTTLLQDFNEIDRHLVAAPSLFSYLSETKKLKEWGLSEDTKTNLTSNYLSFWKSLENIYTIFQTDLLAQNIGYQGLMYRKAADEIPNYLQTTEYQHFFFVGFNALNQAESDIIQYLLKNASTEIYWDIDTYFLKDSLHSASHFIRDYEKGWNYFQKNPLKGISSNYLRPKNIEIIGVPKKVSQAKYTGNLLRQIYNPDQTTALVLSDESVLEPILHALPQNISDYNITMGRPLAQTVLHGFFLSLIEMHSTVSANGLFHRDVTAFLSNPYTTILLRENDQDFAKKLKSYIEKNQLTYITPQALAVFENAPKPILEHIFLEKDSLEKRLADILTIIEHMSAKLSNTDAAIDQFSLDIFKKIFERLIQYTHEHPFISDIRVLKTLYTELVTTEKLYYRGDPNRGLQIMGMLESRNLDFETVIITDVNEGILPAGKSNNSFIPYDLKRIFSMPTHREKDAVYAYHFYRLLQRAQNIYILHNTEPDVLEGGEKSRLVSQLIADENINKNLVQTLASPEIRVTRNTLTCISKTPALVETIQKVAQEGLSPTSLSNYIRNPIDFYKRHILKIEESPLVQESMPLNLFGTLIHDTLELLYTPLLGTVLEPKSIRNLKKDLRGYLNQSFEKNLPQTNYKKGRDLIIYNVILKYLENFLDQELKACQLHEIKIIGLEQKLRHTIHLHDRDLPIILKGKLDRIDEKDGQLRIIDYKTGKVTASELELIEWDDLISEAKYGKAFQLLCYAKMFASEFGVQNLEAGIIPLKKTDSALMGFATKESSRGPKNYLITQETLRNFDEQLNKLILEILDPNVPFIEKEV